MFYLCHIFVIFVISLSSLTHLCRIFTLWPLLGGWSAGGRSGIGRSVGRRSVGWSVGRRSVGIRSAGGGSSVAKRLLGGLKKNKKEKAKNSFLVVAEVVGYIDAPEGARQPVCRQQTLLRLCQRHLLVRMAWRSLLRDSSCLFAPSVRTAVKTEQH